MFARRIIRVILIRSRFKRCKSRQRHKDINNQVQINRNYFSNQLRMQLRNYFNKNIINALSVQSHFHRLNDY